MSSHRTFIKGAAILALAGVTVRFIGAVMRIVLAALMGDEGIGLYQMAYPIYSTLLAISTAGIPVAISKLVAENIALRDYREARRVFRISTAILTLSGLVIAIILAAGANFTAVVIVKEPRAVYPLLAIAPAIFFVTIMSAIRGFFQGQQRMGPTALSQFVEQVARVVVAIVLVLVLLPVGLEYAAAGAAAGAVAGGMAGLLLLIILNLRERKRFNRLVQRQPARHRPASRWTIIKRIFSLAIPITFGSLIMPLSTTLDLAVVPRRLQDAGFTPERATALYGQLTGMASSVIYFPSVVTMALSMSLVPAISEAFVLKQRRLITSRTSVAIKLTVLFAFPAAVGLYLLAEPITILLFNNAEAGYPLAVMSWSLIPLCLYITTTGIMQGLGRPALPVINMAVGALVKVVLAWFLTAIPELHVGGAGWASVVSMIVAALLNLYYIARLTEWRFRWWELVISPGLSVAAMSAAVILFFKIASQVGGAHLSFRVANAVATLGAIIVGVVIYGVALLVSGSLTREELEQIPRYGERLAEIARRLRLIK
ncbi:MAG TPA: polysaccharide biosynthesis protein [Bacillota bacterium]|nr:polysaccharide biosynthesis protein [Bacillota bacterium]HOB87371.1 polysaccharide biosynthesis protein [Bacillota bacterium]HOP68613.1 polysaccharide biosynthesis protein [Bacillota bacterium]HPT33306.1 polysaccharide biosynthesis protein [Bacillota bacterium]HQD05540.1 polysaccharide biosynthesis protein [Bacillota bacterium]